MDDRLATCVEKVKTSENLTTPTTNHFWLDGFQTPHVPGWVGGVKFHMKL